VAGTVVDSKIIFKIAIEYLASGIVLIHNHPSGNCTPSQDDKNLTKKLKDAGLLLDIPILDHLIFTETKYFSFADEGIL
jgi:DNA repair protein RadC